MVKKTTKPAEETPKARPKIQLREGITLRVFAGKMRMKPKDLVEKLGEHGLSLSVNDPVDESLVEFFSKLTGIDIELVPIEKDLKLQAESKTEDLVPRAPVVTIMGHVDHGKTTLLDSIRSSHLVDKESGGITQHIGAYRVFFKNRSITFIDTPGHEAFTQLRARGAQITDIVVLVVAADDGVMPQTKEAIHHALAAKVPIIVAINKIDKPEANIDRVKQQLQKEGLLVEDWGGQVISVSVSAKEKKNLNELLEMILLLSDVIEVKANPKVRAQGIVLEARLDAQKGPLATVIIQHGSLSQGEPFISGKTHGKVRAMFDDVGKAIKSAGPATPVEILGFADVPQAGDYFLVVQDMETARSITLDDLFKKIEEGEIKELAIVIKADVQGSVEVLLDILPSLSSDKVKIKIVHAATGTITEADVLLASASNAIIIGYNVKPPSKIAEMAKKEGVEIRSYKIIYQLSDELKKAMIGLLEPVIKETYLGRAEVRRIFQIPKVGLIAGCYVIDGRVVRNAQARLVRNKEILYQGRISSLKRLKENATEVKKDFECGIGIEGFKDIQPGDFIEAFQTEKVKPE
jgi:translation initiation factor IF-2